MKNADVIIIGTGMGGATLGYALAKKGKRVLFIEKGADRFSNPDVLTNDFAENKFSQPLPEQEELLRCFRNGGRYHQQITDLSQRQKKMIPFIGTGVGGSSSLYGGGLSRFTPDDFTPKKNFSDNNDSTLPESWPITYDDLRPYYVEAEKLYRVAGEGDPFLPGDDFSHFLPPPPLSQSGREVFNYLQSQGIKTYRLPIANDPTPNCMGCTGFICPRNCKKDAGNTCLLPAIQNHGAQLIADCQVIRLESKKNRITEVCAIRNGKPVTFTAPIVVLAAGGLETPRLLLNSANSECPNGLANSSKLVGKNLMRHYVDIYILTPKLKPDWQGNPKEVAFNDFCFNESERLGIAHSAGQPVDAKVVLTEIKKEMSSYFGGATLFQIIKPVVARAVKKTINDKLFMFSIMEDLPYSTNFVRPGSNPHETLDLFYKIHPKEQKRIDLFRKKMLTLFAPYRPSLLKKSADNSMLAHVCGTCRMGDDPASSVVNAQNRTHDIENLYILDASFFASSSAAHPSLTIAANALRIADIAF